MKIKIENLTFNCIIGILPFERKKEQKVIIDCSFKYDYKDGEFIDYSIVANDIKNIMIEKKFELLEEAILYIKNSLKTKFSIKKLKLTIKKPDILSDCEVSLSL